MRAITIAMAAASAPNSEARGRALKRGCSGVPAAGWDSVLLLLDVAPPVYVPVAAASTPSHAGIVARGSSEAKPGSEQ